MPRRLFTLASALSLLLCAATVVLWVFSHRARTELEFGWRGQKCAVFADRGNIGVDNWPEIREYALSRNRRGNTLLLELRSRNSHYPQRPEDMAKVEQVRAKINALNAEVSPAYISNRFRYWAIPFCFMVLPYVWIINFRRRQIRLRVGLCPKCRYNLTGNTTGICPECGTAISRKVQSPP
jgi:hypothetical protein